MGAKAIDPVKKAAVSQHHDIRSRFSARMRASAGDSGRMDTMKNTILAMVTGELYDRAISALKDHLNSKDEYPQFKERATRYVDYAADLINAIKAKRSFPGLQNLAMAKQQELFDRSMEHFEDLKITLKKIEQIDAEVRIEDVRSTVVVVKVTAICVFAILLLAFSIEVSRGLVPSMTFLVDKYLTGGMEWILDKIGI